jgi:hypothetical protein
MAMFFTFGSFLYEVYLVRNAYFWMNLSLVRERVVSNFRIYFYYFLLLFPLPFLISNFAKLWLCDSKIIPLETFGNVFVHFFCIELQLPDVG